MPLSIDDVFAFRIGSDDLPQSGEIIIPDRVR